MKTSPKPKPPEPERMTSAFALERAGGSKRELARILAPLTRQAIQRWREFVPKVHAAKLRRLKRFK